MNESVLTIAQPVLLVADRHMTVEELTALLDEHGVSSAALTEYGKLVGLAHGGSITLGRDRDCLVRDVMTRIRATLSESDTIIEAAAKMAVDDVPALPVVSASGEAVAVVYARDVLGWFAQQQGRAVSATSAARATRHAG